MRTDNSLTTDIFSILDKSRQSNSAKNGVFGSVFEDYLNRSIQTNTPLMSITLPSMFPSLGPDFVLHPNTPYNRQENEITEDTAWRNSSEYEQFRNNILEDQAGRDDVAKRATNCLPMTPPSLDAARERYEAAWDHLNDYAHTAFIDNDIQYAGQIGTRNDGYAGKDGTYVMSHSVYRVGEEDSVKKNLDLMYRSEEGDNITVMAEEVKFYGAIVSLAEKSKAFADAYNKDPEAAIEDFSEELGREMASVKMPYVHTIPNDWSRMLHRALPGEAVDSPWA